MPTELLNNYEYQEDDDLALRLHVVFNLGPEAWALPMAAVREIVRVPAVTRVPRSPSSLLGLANLRGNVIPVFSLRRLMGLEDINDQDCNRAIVLEGDEPMALVVDRISRVSMIDQLEPLTSHQQQADHLIAGACRLCAGFPLVMVLDHTSLLGLCHSYQSAPHESRLSNPDSSNNDQAQNDDADQDLCQFVCCRIAHQEFAIPIEQIRRIIEPGTGISSLPNSPLGILGALNVGDETLMLLHMAELFRLPREPFPERARILITDYPGRGYGLLVDQVIGVLRLHANQIRSIGNIMSGDRDMAQFSGLCQLQQGKRLIAIIDLQRLLLLHGLPVNDSQHLSAPERQALDMDADNNDNDSDLVHMVVYRLGNEEFASPVSCIHEIVRMPERLQPVPTARQQVDGLMNLRGNILPVADLRTRLGMARGESNDRQRILVFSDQNERSGFVVDQVTEILTIPRQPLADENTARNQHNKVINLPASGRLIQVITPDRLLSQHLQHGASL
ncbi:chemotaxis protein CheW [Parathalassolituus penaei]|uniref:Chemotaxis protein CheW n=1 Tax=Parathalassolituus penaei TaxID=2997323 RepID=A0A9X3EF12_9GAMM|nr:chemotaxis protein CheW [Parathalassolituus penaei]MCY0965530.1 chemotaxis protein CheW [Parathalassolituus penaei]